jgi:hypothetical protein
MAVMVGLPLLLALGALSSGFGQVAVDRPYIASRALVPGLLGRSFALLSPVTHLLCVIPGPLFLLAWWGSWQRRWVMASAGTGLTVLLVVLTCQRSETVLAARRLLSGGLADQVSGLYSPGVMSLSLGLGLVGLVWWALPAPGSLVARLVWLCGALLTVDPVPVVLGWFLPSQEVAAPETLVPLLGVEVQHGGALVDLSGGDVRLDGQVVDAAGLSAGLERLGHGDMGSRYFARSKLEPQTWGRRVRAGVRLALPASGSVVDIAGVLAIVTRHGIHEAHWIGANGPRTTATVQRGFEQPAFTVLLDFPVDRMRRPTAPWIWVDESSAQIWDPLGRCSGSFSGTDWVEELDSALLPCRDGVVLLPAPEMNLGTLTRVLDRLGGTGRKVLGQYHLALVPPGPTQERFRRWQAQAGE